MAKPFTVSLPALVLLISSATLYVALSQTCAGACYGCRNKTTGTNTCVNSTWTGAGSCLTAVNGIIPQAPNNTKLPPLYRPTGPVADGVYVLPGLDVGPDLVFGPNLMLEFFRDTKCSEMCLREHYFNGSNAANCDHSPTIDFTDSPIWNMANIDFDQYMDENSQVYCKDDKVVWIRSNEGLQCLGLPEEGKYCKSCPWLAVGWVRGDCGGTHCKAGSSCCKDPTDPSSKGICLPVAKCIMGYSQCCAGEEGCPTPFSRQCGVNVKREAAADPPPPKPYCCMGINDCEQKDLKAGDTCPNGSMPMTEEQCVSSCMKAFVV